MKRFTETNKWNDPWFRKLPGAHKLVFIFLTENCDNAGFYEFDLDHVTYMVGLKPEHVEGALKGLERGIREADGWVWVRNFLKHQKNEFLNPSNPAHRQIIGLILPQVERFKSVSDFKDFLPADDTNSAPSMGLKSPIGTGNGKGQGTGNRKRSAEGKPETREIVYAYAAEISMSKEDADGWFDHFESNGWRIGGKTPMKDWKAALRNGKRMAVTPRNGRHQPPPTVQIAECDKPPIE